MSDSKLPTEAEAKADLAEQAAELTKALSHIPDTIKDSAVSIGKLNRHLPPPWRDMPDWLLAEDPPPRRQGLLYTDRDRRNMMLPRGITAMLAAAGGTGKTTLLYQLALSVACCEPWIGFHPVDTELTKHQGKVLMVLGEEEYRYAARALFWQVHANENIIGNPTKRERIKQNIILYSVYGQPTRFLDPDLATPDGEQAGDRDHPHWTNAYVDLCKYVEQEGPWSLIILDPASRFMGAEAEIDNAQATMFIEQLERLTKAQGNPTVLFAHHTNKASKHASPDSSAARGSSAFTDGVRWQGLLAQRESPRQDGSPWVGNITLHVTKSNYGVPPAPRSLRRKKGEAAWRILTPEEQEQERLEVAKAAALAKLHKAQEDALIAQEAKQQFDAEKDTNKTPRNRFNK